MQYLINHRIICHKMNPLIPSKLYNHLLFLVYCACLTYFSTDAMSEINNSHIQCVEREREALLQFKHGIRVDNCGFLNSWGNTQDCCQWYGIRCNNHSGHVIILNLPGYDEPCLEGKLGISLLELKHLRYLDLSFNYFGGQSIPKFIGSLANLEHLNFSQAGFTGVVPQEIGNLSRLTSLDLQYNNIMKVESLWWLSQLRLLRELNLGSIDLGGTTNSWLSIVNNLPFLQMLRLDDCGLSLTSPSSLSYNNSSTTLGVISLRENNLNDTSIFEWLFNLSGLETNLVYLELSFNQLFGNDLRLSERAVKFIGTLCSLQTLHMVSTNLNYSFSNIVQSFSTCPHKALVSLYFGLNQVWGSIPESIESLSSLRYLFLSGNQLNGTISKALGKLTKLESLDLSSNSLNGTLTVAHLSNLSQLRVLRLGDNKEVKVDISANWIPQFQLHKLDFSSCKVGPHFPKWILTQKNLKLLEISNAGIVDTIPYSFWNSSFLRMYFLNMSHNMIYGELPDVSNFFYGNAVVDLSSNNLEGAIPSFLGNNVSVLNLNSNKFTKGLVPLLCSSKTMKPLIYLYLSNNSFSEKIPDCWRNITGLFALHLNDNHLWGNLPTSIGMLKRLTALHLSNNNLSGELPRTLLSCSSLVIIDLAHNSFTGYLPPNFGLSFKFLAILNLQNNHFFGCLPSSFCYLSQLQLLDLSKNHISGTLPRCIYKLKGMATTNNVLPYLEVDLITYSGTFGYDNELVMWKREEQMFGGNTSLGLLRGIDISSNNLEGQIPEGIANLLGLKFINLSRNHLSGAITSRIGQLVSLESLDLSQNHLSGNIPISLVQINSLAVLDFSNNNLSGKIPVGTQLQSFDDSAYMGNPGLCGAALPKCHEDKAPIVEGNEDNEHDTNDTYLGLYISVVLGIIVGFWGVCGTLVLRQSWRRAFFRFYEDAKDRIYVLVVVVVHITRVWRKS